MQAEGLQDLLDAESQDQLQLSMQQLNGTHSQVYAILRETLVKMLAHVEAYIDFDADETNIVGDVLLPLKSQSKTLIN